MALRRKGYLRPSIKKKDRGQAEWVSGMFFLLMFCVVLYAQLQIFSWHFSSLYLEDALAASNLASALIDIQEYGRTHRARIASPTEAYRIYCGAVKENLQLDQQWLCENKNLISGRVEIADYVVYNVEGETVTASRVDRDGNISGTWSGALGEVSAPNGIVVEHTGVYSEITFPVEGFPGIVIQAHKAKLVDIVAERGEMEEDEEE